MKNLTNQIPFPIQNLYLFKSKIKLTSFFDNEIIQKHEQVIKQKVRDWLIIKLGKSFPVCVVNGSIGVPENLKRYETSFHTESLMGL
jgi:hypothetical protein